MISRRDRFRWFMQGFLFAMLVFGLIALTALTVAWWAF